jgi:hypothetical protein
MTGWKEIIYIGLILIGVILLGLVLGLERHIIAEAFESQEGFFNEPINVDSDVNVQGVTNVNNLNVNNLLKAGDNIYSQQWPSGWSRKGIHAFDIYANGTIGAGRDGVVRSSLRNDGHLCLGGVCVNETELRKLKQMANGNIEANQVCVGTSCLETKSGRLEISKPVVIRSNQHQGLQIYGMNPQHNYLEFRRQDNNTRGRWIGYSGGNWTGR